MLSNIHYIITVVVIKHLVFHVLYINGTNIIYIKENMQITTDLCEWFLGNKKYMNIL